MPLQPGTRLGSYEIVAPLGAGGMGEVYRARDERLGRDIALKVLPAEVAADPDRLARFEREARTVAGISHPNIVMLHSIEEAGAVRFLTMELVEGESLDRLVVPGGLALGRILDLAIPLADALAAAHGRGVVHRDLKPANVMVTSGGRVKVLDFGLAKWAAAEPALDVTMAMTGAAPISSAGQVVGTVPYMAPEQLRGAAVDARADLFSFGVLLFELVSGRRPFEGTTSAEVSSAILRDPPPSARSVRADVSPDLARIIGRCLEKDPEQRFQTAKDVRNELEFLRRGLAAVTGGRDAPAVPPPGPAADLPSIAVLPFANRSRDEDDAYFAEGLADELANVLGKVRGLRVASRTSSQQFKGGVDDLNTIGRRLNVATLLEGSVRTSGNRARIAVQLVKVSDGYHLWSETYDRTLDDIFAVQDDIAQAVVKELRATLLGETPDSAASGEARAEVAAAVRGRGDDPEAHRLFLRGRYLVNRLAGTDVLKGIDYLRQAVTREPQHALAWACLAWAEALSAATGTELPEVGNPRAREAAERALALEPDLAEAHMALGVVRTWYDWDWHGAESSFSRALELAPTHAEVLRSAGMLAFILGRLEEAMVLSRQAIEQDPLHVSGYTYLGRICRVAGRLDEAEDALRKALEISPDGTATHLILGLTLDDQGRREEALAEALAEPAEWARLYGLAVVHRAGGRPAEADQALRDLIRTNGNQAGFQVAVAYAVAGNADGAFEWLERAHAQRDSGLAFLNVEPLLRPLQTDPRWLPLVRRMGLPT